MYCTATRSHSLSQGVITHTHGARYNNNNPNNTEEMILYSVRRLL